MWTTQKEKEGKGEQTGWTKGNSDAGRQDIFKTRSLTGAENLTVL